MDLDYFKEGKVFLIDKPLTWTSFNAVSKIKWLIKKEYKVKKIKVGHAGTLDPLATGLLIICTGKFTKRIEEFQAQEKEYTGTFTLGATTPSYDLETEVDQTYPTEHITEKMINNAVELFIGEQSQYPPIYSALKKEGQRLYDIARAGKTVEIEPRNINIMEFEVTRIKLPEIDFRVVVSKGTYIRSLAFDFGKKLESGAHLSALRRTKIGEYNVDDAISPEEFETQFKEEVL
ncbi:MAG: tRNA pseudouridine(55) synthase TruB [Ichthyobacteriaceae bacterium]|nr:tRNA pseudouridine(55) synthase TruB [Ichthyobacteriaceae bacterium]